MKSLRYVCLLAFALLAACSAQELQRGVSVKMAVANGAQPMPAADEPEAWVVSVGANGTPYFGADSMTYQALTQHLLSHPGKGRQKLYIKADARAKFVSVEEVLRAAHAAEFDEPVLLTTKSPAAPDVGRVMPEGLEVHLGQHGSGEKTVMVELRRQGQGLDVRIDDRSATWEQFANEINRAVSAGKTAVAVRVESDVEFAQLVQILDGCRATGAQTFVPLPAR